MGVSTLESRRKWNENNHDKVKKMEKKSSKKYREKNRKKINEKQREKRIVGTCDIIKKHHEDMKDDPNSLSTEFMQNVIGVDCDY